MSCNVLLQDYTRHTAALTGHNDGPTLPTAKGGVNTSSARLCFCVPTRFSRQPCWLCSFLAGRPHASTDSHVDSFPAKFPNITFRSTFGTGYVGNSPVVAAHSCEHLSGYLPGLRHAIPAQHLRPRRRLPRDKLGRQQDLGWLEGGVSNGIPWPSAYVHGSYLSS
jgi:hypothetical protein